MGSVVIAVAVLLTFLSITSHDFVRWDDGKFIYEDPLVIHLSWQNVTQIWSPSTDCERPAYEPIFYMCLSFVANFARLRAPDQAICESGALLNPHPFHWLSLLLHVGNCLLVYALFLTLLPRRRFACASGALLFGLHPLQAEPVSWAAGAGHPISAMFAIVALLAYVHSAKEGHISGRQALYVTAVVVGILAFFAKPVAFMLPFSALAIDLFVLESNWRKALARFIPWQSALTALLLLTHKFMSLDAEIATPFWTRPFIAGDALMWHMYKLILPLNLGIDYGRNPHYVLNHWWGYLTWLAPAALLLAAYPMRRRHKWFLAAYGIWLAALLPDSGLIPYPFQQYSTVADRYAYFALIGPALSLSIWLSNSRWRYSRLVVSAVIILLAGLSSAQSLIWKDTASLMAQARTANPNSIVARIDLANYYADHGYSDRAIQLYLDALRLDPNSAGPHCMLGRIYLLTGRQAQAENHLRIALALQPRLESAHFYLGKLLVKQDKLDQAIAEFKTCLAIDAHDIAARKDLAIVVSGSACKAPPLIQL